MAESSRLIFEVWLIERPLIAALQVAQRHHTFGVDHAPTRSRDRQQTRTCATTRPRPRPCPAAPDLLALRNELRFGHQSESVSPVVFNVPVCNSLDRVSRVARRNSDGAKTSSPK